MTYYAAWKVLAITMAIIFVVDAASLNINDRVLAVKSNYEDHGLDNYLLSKDLESGLLIPPKPLSNAELRTLIVDSKWKNKYCKVSLEVSLLSVLTSNSHYCLEKLTSGADKGKYKNLCCGSNTCECSWTLGEPYNCRCIAPRVIQ